MSWLGTRLTAFDLPWPEAIFVGLTVTLMAALAVTGTLALWRFFRPLSLIRDTHTILPALDHDPSLSRKDVEAAITLRLGALQRDTVAETFEASDGRAAAMIKHFEERCDELKEGIETTGKLSLKASELQAERNELFGEQIAAALADAKAAHDHSIGSVGALQHLLGELRDAQAKLADEHQSFKRVVEQALENTWNKLENRCEAIDQGFMAILDREMLSDLAADIEALGDELSGPTDRAEPIGNWDAWFKSYQVWRAKVKNWTRIAGEHRAGVDGRVFEIPEAEYRGKWKAKDSYFPDATAVQDYRTFRIVLRNFQSERRHVNSCVRMAAFIRPSLKGRPHPSPRDENQMPRPPKVES